MKTIRKAAVYNSYEISLRVPETARYIAVDEDGMVAAYDRLPYPERRGWGWAYSTPIGHVDNLSFGEALASVPWDKSVRRLR